MDTSHYEKIKLDAQNLYNNFSKIICPALQSDVSFPSYGFNHIMYRKERNERDRPSQIMRFKLLVRMYDLIKITTTYQEYEETIQEFSVKKHKKKVKMSKSVKYWGVIAIINNRKIKVILRKIGNGNIHFWSVVPAWVTNKNRDEKFIKTMKGDPEND